MKQLSTTSSAELDQWVTQYSNEQLTNVVLLFTGTKNASTGKSWCPDCVVADPVIESVVKQTQARDDIVFITIPVGDLPS